MYLAFVPVYLKVWAGYILPPLGPMLFNVSLLHYRYLEPLKEENFLSSEEVVRLVGNIQEIVNFQKQFLKNLEESVDDESYVLSTAIYGFKVTHSQLLVRGIYSYCNFYCDCLGVDSSGLN